MTFKGWCLSSPPLFYPHRMHTGVRCIPILKLVDAELSRSLESQTTPLHKDPSLLVDPESNNSYHYRFPCTRSIVPYCRKEHPQEYTFGLCPDPQHIPAPWLTVKQIVDMFAMRHQLEKYGKDSLWCTLLCWLAQGHGLLHGAFPDSAHWFVSALRFLLSSHCVSRHLLFVWTSIYWLLEWWQKLPITSSHIKVNILWLWRIIQYGR